MPFGTINVDSVVNSDGITSGGAYGFKNRIINGAMVIDQRNAGASVNVVSEIFNLDRWAFATNQTGKLTSQQNAADVTPPTGFKNYLGITSVTSYSVLTGDLFALKHAIEGFNTADLGFGTAGASTVTLSFWVRSSLTGTFGASLVNGAFNRSFVFSYTISSANTWEYKTVTVAGDTSGTWIGATNGIGLRIYFNLGCGSTYVGTANTWSAGGFLAPSGTTSVVGTNAATFYITGVQLEKGSTATSFDYRPYSAELAMCQRYYFKLSALSSVAYFGAGWCESTTRADVVINFPTSMRTNSTALEQSGTASHYRVVDGPSGIACTGVPVFLAGTSATTALVAFDVASGLTIGRGVGAGANSTTSAFLAWSAEL